MESRKKIKRNQNLSQENLKGRKILMKLRSRLSSSMKVNRLRSHNISKTFYFDHLTEEEKQSDNCEGSYSNKNELF